MATSNKNKHLTQSERIIIQTGITNGSSKAAIAQTLGKDKSTIGKEIKLHRVISHKCALPRDCKNYKSCKPGKACISNCDNYVKFTCKRRDRSPGACNGCSTYQYCRYDKFKYLADSAQKEYETDLVESREGVNLTTEEAKKIGSIIKPLLEKGQSPFQIITEHPELNISEKTLYNYIESGVFQVVGITNLDLRNKVSRKIQKKKKTAFKKREDRQFLKGRTYNDYKEYMNTNPHAHVVQMDTVYNDNSIGPFMQTFRFLNTSFLFAVFHETKTANDMVLGLDLLHSILGDDLFFKEVEVLLTDRGSEFYDADGLEFYNETRRTRVFYCDPMQSSQKPHIENNHKYLRYILPKEVNLKELGLTSQDTLNLVLSHINSMDRKKLDGKSPIEFMEFLNYDMAKKFNDFGIIKIDKDKVILKPYLLKTK